MFAIIQNKFQQTNKIKINQINDNHIKLRFLYIFGGSGLLCGTPKTPLTTAMRDCWILLICTVMVTSRRTQWPQTHRTFDSWIILWNAIGETRVLVFVTFWFFGIWSVSILLHIIPRSFGVVHCHYESLEWIIYFLRKSDVFLIIQNTCTIKEVFRSVLRMIDRSGNGTVQIYRISRGSRILATFLS